MLLLDQPYVSPFLRQTIVAYDLPVIATSQSAALDLPAGTRLVDEETAVNALRNGEARLLYSNSENSLDWAAEKLAFSDVPREIALLKDKVRFRELLAPLYPDFRFSAVTAGELDKLDVASLPVPFIIKPSIGFFSIGVYKVSAPEEWPRTLRALQADMQELTAVFPTQVLDTTTFIIEACVPGEEYAMDAYYDHDGEPVIVNVLQHPFSSADDVSDRAYITSKEIVRRYLDQFTALLREIGNLAGLHDFPVHAEVRVTEMGEIVPIEVNPLRFGGWCATDIAHFAFGINPYLMFLRRQQPDWDSILAAKGDEVTGLIVLDRSAELAALDIVGFDAQRLLARFTRPLDWRPIDFQQYPVFGFLIMETDSSGDTAEIDAILQSDLLEFIQRS